MWRLIAKSLGQKDGKTDRESDIIAIIRLMFVLLTVVTNIFIISGIIHNW